MSWGVVFEGGSAEALTAAAYLARRGERPVVCDRGSRVGDELATETFLSPFRFDLDVGFLLAGCEAPDVFAELGLRELGARLLQPDVPLALAFAGRPPFRLHRSWRRTLAAVPGDAAAVERMLSDGRVAQRALLGDAGLETAGVINRLGDASAAEALDHHGIADPDLRCALTYLPLAFGIAPDRPGGGLAAALLAAGLERFTVAAAGTGAIGAALADSIVRDGGTLVEGRQAEDLDAAPGAVVVRAGDRGPLDGAGIARLYLGVRGASPDAVGYVTVVGAESEAAILEHLAAARAGTLASPLGHFTVRSEADRGQAAGLHSVVWQGVLPVTGPDEDVHAVRAELARRCATALGAPEPLFALLRLPHETRAAPAEFDWAALRSGGEALRVGASSVLASITGLASGRSLFYALSR